MPYIEIKGRIPSKKNCKMAIPIGGRCVLITQKKYTEWNKDALWQLKGKEKIPNGSHLTLRFWFPDKRKCDLTNKAESVMDTLVDAGILEDDNYEVVPQVTLVYEMVSKDYPRCEISW